MQSEDQNMVQSLRHFELLSDCIVIGEGCSVGAGGWQPVV